MSGRMTKSRAAKRTSWRCMDAPGGCVCQCHAQAAGRAKSRKPRPILWTPQRNDRLRDLLASGKTQKQIAEILLCSVHAVRHRTNELGLSVRAGWRSDFEVQRALGVSWRFTRRWRSDGLLVFRAHDASTWHRIADADLEMFVRTHAGTEVEVARIRDPHLRRIAEVSASVNQRQAAS